MTNSYRRYRPSPKIDLPNRTWPDKTITQAPQWCAVDLRDGNQALLRPMSPERKRRMFELLVSMGYKQIEVGFPSASTTEYEFVRDLIDHDRIPDDVTIQVLTQAREHLIEKTFAALQGAPKAIVHIYNSTSTLQREVVFNLDREGITKIATDGAWLCLEMRDKLLGTDVTFEYSPESYTGTELDFAAQVCNDVVDIFAENTDGKTIINLPATVEMYTPNLYADSVEWMGRHLNRRDDIVLSLHPHNDRGEAVAAAELGLMAGADRVEGCLFGNGERTGNVDLVTLGLNLHSQGVNPQIDFGDIDKIAEEARWCTGLDVPPRWPYAGEYVYTAFSGSHQDAINKGLQAMAAAAKEQNLPVDEMPWAVPYLPIDPKDVGRTYQAVIRVNSQSGKGGVAYLMRTEHRMDLPRRLQMDFSRIIQQRSETDGGEITSHDMWKLFENEYVHTDAVLEKYRIEEGDGPEVKLSAHVSYGENRWELFGEGTGPIDAFCDALSSLGGNISVVDYFEHSLGTDEAAEAVCYIECDVKTRRMWGVGVHRNIVSASLEAVLSAWVRAG